MKPLMQPLIDRRDPHWDKVVSLLHFDGNFKDEAGVGWSQVGNPLINTGNYKFGSGSFSNNGSAINKIQSNKNLGISNSEGSFTIEAWLYYTGSGSDVNEVLSSRGADIPNALQVEIRNNHLAINWFDSAGANDSAGGVNLLTVPKNQWFHAVWQYDDATEIFSLYQNGQLAKQGQSVYGLKWTSLAEHCIGAHVKNAPANQWFRGLIEELRITKGVARYTKNFTPPSKPFPNK